MVFSVISFAAAILSSIFRASNPTLTTTFFSSTVSQIIKKNSKLEKLEKLEKLKNLKNTKYSKT